MSLTIQLEPVVDARLEVEAVRWGLPKEEMAAKLIAESLPSAETGEDDDSDYILRLTQTIATELPNDALKDVPTDLSKNVDHYLYGHPKSE